MRAHAQRKEGVSWSGQQKMSKRFHPSSPSHLVPQSLLTTASGAKVLPLLILPLLPLSGIPEAVLRPDPSNSDTTSTTPATREREGGREGGLHTYDLHHHQHCKNVLLDGSNFCTQVINLTVVGAPLPL